MSLKFPISLTGKRGGDADSPCSYQGECEVLDPALTYMFNASCVIIKSSGDTTLPQNWGSTKGAYDIYIGSNLTTWGNSLFRSNPRLTSIYIPPTSTQCAIYAFWGATDLHTVTFGGWYHNMGSYSFRYCNNLTRLNCCSPSPTLGISGGTYGTFADCPNLTEVHVPVNGWAGRNNWLGLTVIRDLPAATPEAGSTIAYDSAGNIVAHRPLPVNYGWLNNNQSVYDIEFGTSTTTTGDRAFKDCENLVSVVIPDHITLIDTYSFESCGSLARVDIPRGTALPSAPGNPFYKSYPTIHLPVNHPTTSTQLGNRPIVKDLPAV